MYGRGGLERFKKAQSSEPFSVSVSSAPKPTKAQTLESSSSSSTATGSSVQYLQTNVAQKPAVPEAGPLLGLAAQQHTQVGGGQSTWQPPDWAIEPRSGVYYLQVLKDGEVMDRINLDKRRHIFGRQSVACDFVLDHQSVSRQHAAVVPHRNGSIYVIDLGSAHGTFVANERLTKDIPMELEVGQSLRFAASTRTYVLRKNDAALFTSLPPPAEIILPSSPDLDDEEAVVNYNTQINRYGLEKLCELPDFKPSSHLIRPKHDSQQQPERAAKRRKKARVVFKDHVGGELVEVVGVSDGVDVGTEPGPIGVKEGSLVGRYESLVQSVVIPKGKEGSSSSKESQSSGFLQQGVTNKLQEVLSKVKSAPAQQKGLYHSLYDESFSGKLGSSWASSSAKDGQAKASSGSSENSRSKLSSYDDDDDDDDDLFGD